MKITDSFMEAWRLGNNNGEGYAMGKQSDSPEQAAISEQLTNIIIISPEGNILGYNKNGDPIVVCNSNGPWAVNIAKYTS